MKRTVLVEAGRRPEEERICTLLNFDNTLSLQKNLLQYPHLWIDCTDIPQTFGFCTDQSLDQIRTRLDIGGKGWITLMGSGNYHYVTYLLLEKLKRPISLVLFDHHTDMNEPDPLLSCGSWVQAALRNLPWLNKVAIIGVNETDYQHMNEKNAFRNRVLIVNERRLAEGELYSLVSDLLSFLHGERTLYFSIDKDVLYSLEATTDWDQGTMSLVQLLFLMEKLALEREIAGIDVCGEYLPDGEDLYRTENYERMKMNEIVNCMLVEFSRQLKHRVFHRHR